VHKAFVLDENSALTTRMGSLGYYKFADIQVATQQPEAHLTITQGGLLVHQHKSCPLISTDTIESISDSRQGNIFGGQSRAQRMITIEARISIEFGTLGRMGWREGWKWV
jgi:hypothetical protein